MRLASGRAGGLAAACALLLAATGCSSVEDRFGDPAVLETDIEPVELAYDGPTYMAVVGPDLLVRNGDESQRIPDARAVSWLSSGSALVATGSRVQVVDPTTGPVGSPLRMREEPSTAVTQIDHVQRIGASAAYRWRSYDLDLEELRTVTLPLIDDPRATAANEAERTYYGAVPTLDGTTFVPWHDGSEWYEDGDYGVLRIQGEQQSNVLINQNIVGLHLSADGTGLLGLRQSSGKPCGGCVVEQDIVEIDPESGEIGAEYGAPEEYQAGWRVAAADRVGDRVAVRYYEAVGQGARFDYEQRGTWVYDGGWSMVDGSEEELTWWQGGDRIVARVDDSERRRGDGFDLFWVHDGEETPLPGELSPRPLGVPSGTAVAGQLLPSER